MNLAVAILAGGFATRLHPLTLKCPKSLIPINGYPFIKWQLELLAKQGIRLVVLCLGHMASEIRDFVGNGRQFGLEVEYSIEGTPLGTGGAIKNAEHLLGEVFGVLYGDSYLVMDYSNVFHTSIKSNHLVLMTIFHNYNDLDTSNVMFRADKSIYYSKKDITGEMQYIDYGFSVFKRDALGFIPTDTPSDLSETIELLSKNGQVGGFEVNDRFYEVGSPEGIVDLENYLRSDKK